jgi:hypothetical protein
MTTTYTPRKSVSRKVSAMVTIVTVTDDGEGYTDTMAYFDTIEDARVAAVAMITARDWSFTTEAIRAEFLAGEHDGQIMWEDDDDGEHVGAVYAFATTARVTRKLQF